MSEQRNMFDDLNEALFAQINKLQSIDPTDKEQMEQTIEQSRAVSSLASNVISNANTAVSLMKFQSDLGIELGNKGATTPKMLTGHY